jgi:peroxiredoxin (alkyl hydroperoxide reductase subunit C)
MSRLLGLGERFPEFSMQACVSAEPGSEFQTIDSHHLEGTWVAIFFWPLDFTFVCPTELVEFNRALREFRALGARVFGVSGDSHHTHLAWRQENPALRRLEFPMLADDRKQVAEELGILDPVENVPLRATYLLDAERKIRWLCVNDLSVGRSTGEVLRVLAALRCGELCPANWAPGQATLDRAPDKGKAVPWETRDPAPART